MLPELELLDHLVHRRPRTVLGSLLQLLVVGIPFMFCVHAVAVRLLGVFSGVIPLSSLLVDGGMLAALTAVFAFRAWFANRQYEYAVDRAEGLGDQVFRTFNALYGRQGARHFELLHAAAIEDARERLLAREEVKSRTTWGKIADVKPTWRYLGSIANRLPVWSPPPLLQSRFQVTYTGGDIAVECVNQSALLDLMLACGQDLDPTTADLVYPHVLDRTPQQLKYEPAAMAGAWEFEPN